MGLAIGLAVHNSLILDLRLPPLLYRRLLNEPVGLSDLKEVRIGPNPNPHPHPNPHPNLNPEP